MVVSIGGEALTEQELCGKAKELMQYVLPQAIKSWTVYIDPKFEDDKYVVTASSGRFRIRTELTKEAIETMSEETLKPPTLVYYDVEIHTEQLPPEQ